VIHDGIDTQTCIPVEDKRIFLDNGLRLSRADEVVTYVSRNLEPYRGFPSFMRAAAIVSRRRPHCHFLIIGGDSVSYGRRLPKGETYRQSMLAEVDVDPTRFHFLGRVPYRRFLDCLQVSSVHVYLTFPFVLSWSMLEAMSAGCLVLGSDTPPVAEVIEDGRNGLLTDFFSPEAIAGRVDEVLDHPDRMANVRMRARETVLERYALERCLPRHLAVIEKLMNGDRPEAPASLEPPLTPHSANRTTGDKQISKSA
jgi:glycosyltransferase involved in cell wall biosynthesis